MSPCFNTGQHRNLRWDRRQGVVHSRSAVCSQRRSGCGDRCEEVLAGLDEVGGGCNLCGCPDFTREAFGERTMLLCDQCEREFHVGCLRDAGRGEVLGDTLPEGDLPYKAPFASPSIRILITRITIIYSPPRAPYVSPSCPCCVHVR